MSFDQAGAVVFQIRPSVNIHTGLMSCFDFSRESIERLIDLGYSDARTSFEDAHDIFEKLVELKQFGEIEEKLANALPDRRRR